MELALSLGDSSKPLTPSFLDNVPVNLSSTDVDFGGGLRLNGGGRPGKEADGDAPPSLQLDLLPFSPVPRSKPPSSQFRLPWLSEACKRKYIFAPPVTVLKLDCMLPVGSSEQEPGRGVDVNRFPANGDDVDDGAAHSSPNSAMSSFQMEFGGRSKRDFEETEAEKDGSRGGSDDDENGSTRKKLRLSKEQSAFLEESFKEHSTLNPKQKLELAKQLNLRPRQVEVWFQNRRARTKLKQTEIDCEYLKRCCETLTAENHRLQKELKELRVLKTSHPFYMQLPATTLTMCPSCERVATTSSSTSAVAAGSSSSAATNSGKVRTFSFAGTMEGYKASS